MDTAEKRRWAIQLSILVITLAAIAYPLEQDHDVTSSSKSAHPSHSATKATPVLETEATRAAESPASEIDPFARRSWHAQPVASVVPSGVAVVTVDPVLPPEPAGPPPLPFRFTGRMNDGGDQVIYLSRGDQILVARTGETLEGTYKVLAVDAQRMEFMHLPTGEKQTLSLPTTDN